MAAADGLGAADRRQLERKVRTRRSRIGIGVLRHAREQCRSPQHVDLVAGVLAVAAKRQPAAAGDELGMPTGPAEALAQAKVGPRARCDGDVVAEQRVEFGIVEVDAVREEQMGPEHS